MSARAAIALGSNLDDRETHLSGAIAELSAHSSITTIASSSFHETEAVGPNIDGNPQPSYLNAAIVIETTLSPRELLDCLLAIEHAHGRERATEERWGPRTLDLDILLYTDNNRLNVTIDEDTLTIPHPRMHERDFVLKPLAEIASDWLHPIQNQSVAELLARMTAITR
ncbi:MAG: 2-amino-4-hydroxy-6-hydroxymethyldihydropteridine diphosphokinase [Planctomycetota bacterium]